VDEITRLIVEKLLLTPTEQLKSLTDADTVGAYAEALTLLFGLNGPAPNQESERKVEPFIRPSTRAGRPEPAEGRSNKR
jgi:hypothetical protein